MTSGQMPQYGVTISMPGNVNFIKTQRGCRGIKSGDLVKQLDSIAQYM